jgi:hypothetical protein
MVPAISRSYHPSKAPRGRPATNKPLFHDARTLFTTHLRKLFPTIMLPKEALAYTMVTACRAATRADDPKPLDTVSPGKMSHLCGFMVFCCGKGGD